MSARRFYLAAYDVTDPPRLQAALRVLKNYSTGGQKSVFECFLTEGEKEALVLEVKNTLDLTSDRFLLMPVTETVSTLGIAIAPCDPDFYYVG
ncbi:MAG: CRISPR-associated endonuclease Cas2 [Pseudomonadota bacterium]